MSFFEQHPQQQFQHQSRPVIRYDGRRGRKEIQRKAVDFHSAALRYISFGRPYQHPLRKQADKANVIPPHPEFEQDLGLPSESPMTPAESICCRFVHTSKNKVTNCPSTSICWYPNAQRLIAGSQSGHFTLWNGCTFNFITSLPAHNSAVMRMQWNHTGNWFLSSDQEGIVRYWQPNINEVRDVIVPLSQPEPVCDLCFAPTDEKFATACDDQYASIFDFESGHRERLLTGHGGEVKSVDWHPRHSLVVTGSKDSLVKLWDPRTADCLSTLHQHKSSVNRTRFHRNGHWLVSTGRDQLVKMVDIRTMKEFRTFKGHKRDIVACAVHPYHDELIATGDLGGAVMFWLASQPDSPAAQLNEAHDHAVRDIQWHPMGYLLATSSNDQSVKFWSRSRPGDDCVNGRSYNNQRDSSTSGRGFGLRDDGFGKTPDWVPGLDRGDQDNQMYGGRRR